MTLTNGLRKVILEEENYNILISSKIGHLAGARGNVVSNPQSEPN